MWLERVLAKFSHRDQPLVVVGGEPYGVPFVIETLTRQRRVAWLNIHPAYANDYVAIGNLLAEAVNSAFSASLLTQALPYTFSIDVLKEQLPHIGPLTIVCSGAENNEVFAHALAGLQGESCFVILTSVSELSLPLETTLIGAADLELTLEEAEYLTYATLTTDEMNMLYRSCRGAYTTFINSLLRIRGEPPILVPHPTGSYVTEGQEQLMTPSELLETLLHLKRYVEALNLAVMSTPQRVPEFISEAGPIYQERGMLGTLHLLLESLDDDLKADEEVLTWRLVAGVSVGDSTQILEQVERHLELHEAPLLRARYAGTIINSERRVAEATRAAGQLPTPLTLFQLGRLHPDPHEGISILRNSVKLAEHYGRPYEVARNAGALSQRLFHSGQFEQAGYWSEWALHFFDRYKLEDGTRRLNLLNVWAYSRILLGQTVGLEPILQEAARSLQHTELGLRSEFLATLQDLMLVLGHLGEAEAMARENMRGSPRHLIGERAVALVRIYLEQDKLECALLEGRRAIEMTTEDDESYMLPAYLAFGMAQAVVAPDVAKPHLIRVMEATSLSFHYRSAAALYLILAHNGDVSVLPETQLAVLRSLSQSGLRLLSGPTHLFWPIWQTLLGQDAPLHISALGRGKVIYRGEPLKLPPRLFEILVLLCLNPRGLSLAQLHTLLYDDSADTMPSGLNVSVSRLRKLVPVTTQPFRIAEIFYLDVKACKSALDEGRVRDALELYRGPLLDESDAPGITEERLILEEQIRQATLLANDPEVLFALSEAVGDDRELWEATQAALSRGDPRRAVVNARLSNLRF